MLCRWFMPVDYFIYILTSIDTSLASYTFGIQIMISLNSNADRIYHYTPYIVKGICVTTCLLIVSLVFFL